MRKIKKQLANKVGGKDYGMVKRISLITFLFTCILGGMYLYISYSLSKVVIPERMPGIPETAQWHGGPDGGVWINIDTTNIENQFNIHCYFDRTGDLWEKGIFVLDSLSEVCVFSVQELHERISFYNGYGFSFSSEMYREHPKALLRKLKN